MLRTCQVAVFAADDILLSFGWRLKILHVLFLGDFVGRGLSAPVILSTLVWGVHVTSL
jgi:hypothetical protein